MRWEDDAQAVVALPVGGASQPNGNTTFGYAREREVILGADLVDAAILDAKGLVLAFANQRWRGIGGEVDSIIAPGKAKMGQGRQVGDTFVAKDARVGIVELGIVGGDT